MRNTSKQMWVGAILSYVNIVVRNVVAIFYTPLLLHFVGKSDYGLYQLANQTINTLSLLTLGFSGAYVRFYWMYKNGGEDGENKIKQLNGVFFSIFGIASLITLIVGLVGSNHVAWVFGNTFSGTELSLARQLFVLLAINLMLTFPSAVFDSYILANQQFRFQQVRALLTTIAQPALVIPALFFGANVVIIVVVQTIITTVFLVLNARYAITRLNMRVVISKRALSMFPAIFTFSLFIMFNEFVDVINNNVPSYIVGMKLGAAQVSEYSVAMIIKNLFFQLSVALSAVFVPKVNELITSGADDRAMTDLMIDVGRKQLCITSFIMGGFIVVGPYFIKLWVGSQFSEVYTLVLLMVIPVLLPLAQNIGIEIQRAKNMHSFRTLVLLFFAILNVLITYFSVTFFGLEGATFGYIFAIIFGNGLAVNIYNHRKVGLNMFKFWKDVGNIILPVVGAATIGIISRNVVDLKSTVVSFMTFGSLYVIVFALIVPVILTEKESNQIRRVLRKVKRNS